MSTRWIATLASVLTSALLLGAAAPAAAQCTSSDVPAGGIFTKMDADYDQNFFSLTIINLSDAPLDALVDINASLAEWRVLGVRWSCALPPFYKLCSSTAMEDNKFTCWDETSGFHPEPWQLRVEEHGSAIWKRGGQNNCYEGKMDFTWRTSRFQVKFKRQKVYGGSLAYPHYGTWTTLLPLAGSWCGAGESCSGVWTTPRDYEMRNITTIAGNELAVALYSADNKNLVVVLRETHWKGLEGDAYHGKQLDWVDNDSPRVPGECNQ